MHASESSQARTSELYQAALLHVSDTYDAHCDNIVVRFASNEAERQVLAERWHTDGNGIINEPRVQNRLVL